MLGEDFKKARTAWLYPIVPMQTLWRAVGLTLLVFICWQLLLGISQGLVFGLGFPESAKAAYDQMYAGGSWTPKLDALPNAVMADLARAGIMALFPANLCTAFLALALVRFGLPGRAGKLPLEWPKIGAVGWILLILAFVIGTEITFAIFGTAIGIDSQKNLGLVEQVTMDMLGNPHFFALAVPGVVIGAPIAEELMFRGALFAGIAQSRLGRVGAVVITAALWASLHGVSESLFSVTMIFMMGLALGALLLRFGSIWVTIACHTAWNATFVLIAYFAVSHA